MVMESNVVESHLTCPICFDIPRHEIIQCRKGHHVCKGCQKSLSNCPQCRIPYDKEDIRNLAMESLLDTMEFPCPFKREGCPAKLPRKDLDSHDNSCKFNPASKQFCSRNLGWTDCKVAVDDSSILSHLEEHHPVQKIDCSTFQIGLEYHERSIGENGFVYFDPVVVTSLGTPILLRTVMTGSGHIVLTCFMFRESEKASTKRFRVKFRVEFQEKAKIEWSGFVQPYRKFEEINNLNSFHIPIPSVKEQVDQSGAYSQSVDRVTNQSINIKVAVYKATNNAPRLKTGVFKEINIFEQPRPDGQSPIDTHGIIAGICDVCEVYTENDFYKCLQCPDYILCSRCLKLDHHSQHVFVRLRDTSQSGTFHNEFWRKYKSVGLGINN